MALGSPDLPAQRSLSPDVQAAINDTFEVFSTLTPRDLDASWQAFWHPAEQAAVDNQSLRQLPEELMGFVLANVVCLYGGKNDLKYFLPRLLEVAVQRPVREGVTEVLSRAYQAGLWCWPEAERTSVRRFLLAWWRQVLNEPVSFDTFPVDDALCAAAFAFNDLSVLLYEWGREGGLNATLHVMNTARLHLSEEGEGLHLALHPYWDQRPVQAEQFRAWLLSPAVLERLGNAAARVNEEPAHELLGATTAQLSQLVAR